MYRQLILIACLLLAALSEAKSTQKRTSVVLDLSPTTECSEGSVKCQSSDKCISKGWICDGDNDCGDNSDEPESCFSRECTDDELKCNSGQCINKNDYCTGGARCRDGTIFTSNDCPHVHCEANEVKCKHLSKCISNSYICDGDNDCGDMSDEPLECRERQCATGEVRCNNGQCLNQTLVCMQGLTCRDFTSLSGACESFTCPVGWTSCSSGEKCVEESHLCDGIAQCSDESDESMEHCDRPLECDSSTTFRCLKFRRCVPKSFLCDTDNDCKDNSDEDESFCSSRACESNEIRCYNGQCVQKEAYCNGYSSCRDQSLRDTSDICGQQGNEEQNNPLSPSQNLPTQQLPCFMVVSQMRQTCGESSVEQLFQGLSPREIYDKLVEIDLREICSPLQQWLGCVTNAFKDCDDTNFDMLAEIKKTFFAAESALNYVCVEEIDAINSHKACLLKEDNQVQSSTEPIPELAVRINRSCFHLIAQLRPTLHDCLPADLTSCVKQVVADQCGNEIATVLEGLSDRVHHVLNCPSDRVRSLPAHNKHAGFSVYKRFLESFI